MQQTSSVVTLLAARNDSRSRERYSCYLEAARQHQPEKAANSEIIDLIRSALKPPFSTTCVSRMKRVRPTIFLVHRAVYLLSLPGPFFGVLMPADALEPLKYPAQITPKRAGFFLFLPGFVLPCRNKVAVCKS